MATVASCLALIATSAHAAFPGQNGLLVFVRTGQLYTIAATGSVPVQLTHGGKNRAPVWSPDGSRLAYLHSTSTSGADIWVMNADGTDKQQVTHLGNAQAPAWSPDGDWLAFGSPLQKVRARAPFGAPEILAARVESDCCQDQPWGVRGRVAWSVDGDHIAFVSSQFPSSPDTYLLEYSLRTHEIAGLDSIGGSCCGEGTFIDPFYASDGRGPFITVDNDPDADDPTDAPPEFYVTAKDGSPFPSQPYDQQGALSPNDKSIAFANNATGRWRIFTEKLDGTARKRLTPGSQPDWQPTSTTPWVAPPPPDPDTIAPLLSFSYPATFRVGREVSVSNYFDADTSNDYTRTPMRFDWNGSDPESGICGYDVSDQAGRVLVSDGSRSYLLGSGTNKSYRFQYNIAAHDCAGNMSEGSWYRLIDVVDDSGQGPTSWAADVTFNGTWAVSTCQCWSGGTTHKTYEPGASAELTSFYAGNVGVVMAKGPDRGQADIYLNGELVRTVNTYSASGSNRVIMANIPTDPNLQNTITVVNRATSGHARIDVDAFLLSD
jgi:hypothetical protein